MGCLPAKPCQARRLATTDGGARWRLLNMPDAPVTTVMFASPQDGWLYDQTGPYGQRVAGLWATHDRGGH